jgi:uncharacterized protein (TIGR02300 family)
MTEALGKKMICQECSTKFFDMGKSKAKCPRCGSGSVMNLELAIIKARPKEIPVPVIELEDEPVADVDDDDAEETDADELSSDEDRLGEDEEGDEMDAEPEDSYEADEL